MVNQYGQWTPDFPGQQPGQDPAFVRAYGQPQNGQRTGNTQGQQMLTPPTIRAEIVQIDDLSGMDHFPMAAGTQQMFITKDESSIAIRSTYANGQHSDTIYDKRPPAPPEPKINPEEYVRRDEIGRLIADGIQSQLEKKITRRKEPEE